MSTIPTLKFKTSGWCEALKCSYRKGHYKPKTKKEYDALKAFAENAADLFDSGDEEKEALVARAIELKLDSPSNLGRWGVDRLTAAIAEAEKSDHDKEEGEGNPDPDVETEGSEDSEE